jgi:hypothetical protein
MLLAQKVGMESGLRGGANIINQWIEIMKWISMELLPNGFMVLRIMNNVILCTNCVDCASARSWSGSHYTITFQWKQGEPYHPGLCLRPTIH